MFRHFGHEDVAVLDGGLSAWQAMGNTVENFARGASERHFTARQNTLLVRDLDAVRSNITNKNEQVLDVRSSGRFHATEAEPRPELRPGHIPGSLNLPYTELLETDGRLKAVAALKDVFNRAGVVLHKPIITTCGSGVTAAVAALALYEVDAAQVAVYDGSWSEWGGRPDTPIVR